MAANYVDSVYSRVSRARNHLHRDRKLLHHFPRPTQNFYGRELELTKIQNLVFKCQNAKDFLDKILVISGIEGMGKREIVKVFLENVKSQFDYIFWIHAQSRSSMYSSFEQILTFLNIPFQEEGNEASKMSCKLYYWLENNNYSNGIFIFENAESLHNQTDIVGIDIYLQPPPSCKKPVIIVTTPNSWEDLEGKVKIIHIDQLRKEEAMMCFLKILGIGTREIPTSLTNTIEKLVNTLDCHPLAISLIGVEATVNQEDISLAEVKARISKYLQLLENESMKGFSFGGKEKYEQNLKTILDEKIRRLEITEEREDATQILNIISFLSPDNIYVGLVNSIFFKEGFNPFREGFLVSDADLEMTFKLLQSRSLIKIETVRTTEGTFDMIRIHGLVRKCAQNPSSELIKPRDTVRLIAEFFEQNEDNDKYRNHIWAILKTQETPSLRLENLSVLFILYMSMDPVRWVFTDDVQKRLVRSGKWDDGEDNVRHLIQSLDRPQVLLFFEELELLIWRLPRDLATTDWIIELCAQAVLNHSGLYHLKDRDLNSIHECLERRHKECPSVRRPLEDLLECLIHDI